MRAGKAGEPAPSLRIDARDPGRRAGHSKNIHMTVPAPADMGTAIIGVEAGAAIELDLLLQAVGEGVLVTGDARVPISGECSRCLEPIAYTETVELMSLFTYPPTDARGRLIPIDDDGDTRDSEALWVEEDHVDLEGPLRDAVVLGLPLAPLCEPGCPGLCPECGAHLREAGEHSHEVVDPRWQGLATLLPPVPQDQQDVPDPKED